MNWKIGILSICDRGPRGQLEDTSAQVIREMVEEELQGEVVEYRIVPHEKPEIMAALIEMTDYFQADLILTTGGIGLSPRDVVPEATQDVSDRLAPGFAEAIRQSLLPTHPQIIRTRGISSLRGKALIINLPAEPTLVHKSLVTILPALPDTLLELKQPVTGQHTLDTMSP